MKARPMIFCFLLVVPIECCVVDCVMPTTSVEITLGFSSLETSIYPGLTNAGLPIHADRKSALVFAGLRWSGLRWSMLVGIHVCAGLHIHDGRVFDFLEDKSSSFGLIDADMHVGITTNVTMDTESRLFCL